MKIAAIYRPLADFDYLEASLRSVARNVDLILIGVTGRDEAALAGFLSGISGFEVPVEPIRGDWSVDGAPPRELGETLAAKGMEWALLMDGQDVYSADDLERLLAFAEDHPEAGQFRARVHHYWKSPRYRIDPPDPAGQVALCRLSSGAGKLPAVTVPGEVGACHSFTFAGPTSTVLRRLQRTGLTAQAAANWRKTVWETWNGNRMQRNLHPEQAERFRAAVRIQPALLPEAMAGHPRLDEEIAGQKLAAPSACGLVIAVRNDDAATTRAFVHTLAETIPDDCEILVVSAERNALRAAASVPGVTAVEAAAHTPLIDVWRRGAKSALSNNLVLMTTDLRTTGDWVEGFLSALEQDGATVYLPGRGGELGTE
ncbi:MAG TPA: hypothetical protein VFY29_04810, partial [Terriglobia bacterium]|nr:hypothetical protein [Terriglobia bacterium]